MNEEPLDFLGIPRLRRWEDVNILSTFSSLLLTSFFDNQLQASQGQLQILQSQLSETNSSAKIQELYQNIKNKYNIFAENQELLKALEQESQNSPNNINLNQNSEDLLQNFNNEYSHLFREIQKLEQQLPNDKKTEVNNLIYQLEGEDINLKAIANLFQDGELNQEEICENIQIPLQVFPDNSSPDCGQFDAKTYTAFAEFLTQQNQLIQEKLGALDSLITQLNTENTPADNVTSTENESPISSPTPSITDNNNNDENKLPVLLGMMGFLLGLVSICFALMNYLQIKKLVSNRQKNINDAEQNQAKIQDLENRIRNYSQQIDTLNNRIYDLKSSFDTQSLQLRKLESQSQQSNIRPQNNPQYTSKTNFNPSNSGNPSVEKLPTTPPVSNSENIRLAKQYQENPASFLQNAIQVGMTKETTNQILGGVWEQIFLEPNRRGEYFIVTSNSGELYLFLDPNSRFNPQILSIINKSNLFVCDGNLGQSRKGAEITIEKPATVKKVGQNWILQESGRINLEY